MLRKERYGHDTYEIATPSRRPARFPAPRRPGDATLGNNIVGVGREQDWNSHGIEHELSGLYDCAHGAGLAVIMPAWMEYVYKHDVMRFCQWATRVWGCKMDYAEPEATALEGIHRFREFLHNIGMPINFSELGAKENDIALLVKKFGLADEQTTGGFVHLSSADITEIYKLAAKAVL